MRLIVAESGFSPVTSSKGWEVLSRSPARRVLLSLLDLSCGARPRAVVLEVTSAFAAIGGRVARTIAKRTDSAIYG